MIRTLTLALTATLAVATAAHAQSPPTAGDLDLLRMSSAALGAPSQLRLGVAAEYFQADRFLLATPDGGQDSHRRLGATLNIGYTANPWWEIHGTLSGAANRNQRFCTQGMAASCQDEPGRTDAQVIRTFGDLALGTRLAWPRPLPGGLRLGGQLTAGLPASPTGLSFAPAAVTAALDALLGWDPAEVAGHPPGRWTVLLPRAHLSLGQVLDRSRQRVDLAAAPVRSRLVSEFAYGMGGHRARAAAGLDWRVGGLPAGLSIRPMVEYHLQLATGDAQALFVAPGDSDNRDEHALVAGVAVGTREGLTVSAGAALPLRSMGRGYGPRLPPYNVLLAVGQRFDVGTRVVTRTVTVERRLPAVPRQGHATGRITDAAGSPIDGALVSVPGGARTRVVSDADGGFRTSALSPGRHLLQVSAPGFRTRQLPAQVVAGSEVSVPVVLEPAGAAVAGRLADGSGAPLVGQLRVASAVQPREIASDPTGAFRLFLPPGLFRLEVQVEGFLRKGARVTSEDGRDVQLNLSLRRRPETPMVLVEAGTIRFVAPVTVPSADPAAPDVFAPDVQAALDELVDALLAHPELARVRLEASWERSRDAEQARRSSEAQARAAADYVIANGVEETRVQAVGLGASATRGPRRLEIRVIQ